MTESTRHSSLTRRDLMKLSATVALAGSAVALVLFPAPVMTAAVAGLLLTVAIAYLLSRTSGIPGVTAHTAPFDAFGSVVALLEVAAAFVAVRQPNPRRI